MANVIRLIFITVLWASVFSLPDSLVLFQTLESTPQGQSSRVDSVSYNQNGSLLITLANSLISVWGVDPTGSYTRIQTVSPPQTLSAAQLLGSSSKLVASSTGSTGYVWRLNTQTRRFNIWQNVSEGDSSQNYTAVGLSTDGTALVMGSTDGTVYVWSLNSTSDKF